MIPLIPKPYTDKPDTHDSSAFIKGVFMLLLLLCYSSLPYANAGFQTHHTLHVEIIPDSGQLIVTDRLKLPEATHSFEFLLHANLIPTLSKPEGRLTHIKTLSGRVPVNHYRLDFKSSASAFTLNYKGQIAHALSQEGERASLRQTTPGTISKKGVFLSASSFWYPQSGSALISFSMQVTLPEGWRSVSQGRSLPNQTGWVELQPQEEIYLVAAPYKRFQKNASGILTEVYLREDNKPLAERYLQATDRYLSLYERLIGPYPYSKFSLVENFWETGYGMPSFTLLGPRVIQLPFIINTSYPHEILHNWWGNGVYTDSTSGNWSEGLTTYLADHLIKEQQGEGSNYRRNSLQNYVSYVTKQDDFPLIEFRGNQGQISQSIGYGKTLMLFHMLRKELGDELFIAGIRSLYKNYQFRRAGFNQIQERFEAVSNRSLELFFNQWLKRTGAPTLKLVDVTYQPSTSGNKLTVSIEQTQPKAPFNLTVPLFISGEGNNATEWHTLDMTKRKQTWIINTSLTPVSLAVDPLFDLFRRLDDSEIPSSLSQLFGAKKVFAILPNTATDSMKQAYQSLVTEWQQRQPGLTLLWDNEITALPKQAHTWIIGRSNRYASELLQHIDRRATGLNGGTRAITVRNPSQLNQTLGYIESDSIEAIKGLSRKLPHYGKYSYALFNGNEPSVTKRGEWNITDNAMSWTLNRNVSGVTGKLTERPPLITP
ncbi:MAG: M1 family aminopeptidase [Sedimenticola sp.]|nr:M1 family aminopeptidase [Sedimenticola sp.]